MLNILDVNRFMSVEEIGCCGAYCGTCRVYAEKACQGCKIGYKNGDRDITKAKCKMKVCCIKKKLNSCADCLDYSTCAVIHEFYGKNGYKYTKYKQAIDFIRNNDYDSFLELAEKWKNAYGKYE